MSSFASVCNYAGLGNLLSILNDDVFITDKYVVCTIMDPTTLYNIQITHPLKQVIYSPNPLLLVSSKKEKDMSTVVVFYGGKDVSENIIRVISHLRDYKVEKVKINSIRSKEVLEYSRKASLVVYDQVEVTNYYYLTFTSGTAFFIYNSRYSESFSELVYMTNIQECLFDDIDDYDELKIKFHTIVHNKDKFESLVASSKDTLKNILAYVKSGKIVNTNLKNENYVGDPYRYTLSKQMSALDNLYLEISLTKLTSAILYPFIGIIDTYDKSVAIRVLESDNFNASIMMCMGIIVYSKVIKSIVEAKFRSINKIVDITLISGPPTTKEEVSFNINQWKKNKKIILVSDKIVMKEDNKDPVPLEHLNYNEHVNSIIVLHETQDIDMIANIMLCVSRNIPIFILNTDPKLINNDTKGILGNNYPVRLGPKNRGLNDVLEMCTDNNIQLCLDKIAEVRLTHPSCDDLLSSFNIAL